MEKWSGHLGNSLTVSYKIKIHSPYDPVIPILDIYPGTNVNICPHQDAYANSIFHNKNKLEHQIAINWQLISKFLYYAILLSTKKK